MCEMRERIMFDRSPAILGLVLPFGPKPNLVKFAGK